jgi:predicted GNAT superfamily acetyltransferase
MSLLSEAAQTILNPDSHAGDLLDAVGDLQREFAQLTGVHDSSGDPADHRATVLDSGAAISPQDAARCILDFARTTTFLRGIQEAILAARVRFGSAKIEVLYAGCGPYAPLALPLITMVDSAEVGFTFLDIHQRSLDATRTLVEHYGLSGHVTGYLCADATKVKLQEKPHIIVAETMQRALSKEPQLALTANLAPQLIEGGILIPERIRVDLCAADVDAEFNAVPASEGADGGTRARVGLATLLDLSRTTVGGIMASAEGSSLPAISVAVPDLPPEREWTAMLCTEVVVFDGHVLGDYDSGVSYPEILHDIGLLRGGEELELEYELGASPGFAVRLHTPLLIRTATPDDALSILALNLESEHLLSPLNGERLKHLDGQSSYHRVVELDGQVVAFLLALRENADYDSPNYRWFDEARDEFIYVDRVVVSERHRGKRLASALYDDLFAYARDQGIHEVTCEFNIDPPNAASRAFHASYGFTEVGMQTLDEGRTVSLQIATLRHQ